MILTKILKNNLMILIRNLIYYKIIKIHNNLMILIKKLINYNKLIRIQH